MMEASTPMAMEESVAKMVSLCSRLKRDVKGGFTGDLDEMGAIIKEEMGAVLKASPDAALLVIETLLKLNPQRYRRKMQCVHLLVKMQEVGPAVSPEVREKALRLAQEHKKKKLLPVRVLGGSMDAIVFLELIVAYHLIPMFNDDLDLLLCLFSRIFSSAKTDHYFIHSSTELLEKMKCNMRQIDAVKFVYIYNLVDKFPPAPLLLAHVKDIKKAIEEKRKKGKASFSFAAAAEIGAIGCVLQTVNDYKIEDFPRQIFEKRMDQLKTESVAEEKLRTNKKRSAAVYDSSNSKDEQPNKRSLTALGASFQILCLEEKSTPLMG